MFRLGINPPIEPIEGFLNHLKSLSSSTNFNSVMSSQTMDFVTSLHEDTGYRSKDWNHAVQSQLGTTERNDMTEAQKKIYCLLKAFGATLSHPGNLERFPKADAAGLFNTPSFKQYHEEALSLKAGPSVTTSTTSTTTNSINALIGGETRLHIAVRNKSLASVKEVVENRAFTAIETRDNQGKTALDHMYIAIQGKAASSVALDWKEIIITLLRHGAVATSEQYNAFAALGIDAA